MDEGITIKKAVEKYTREIEALTKQYEEILHKLTDLTAKRDILMKAADVLAAEESVDEHDPTQELTGHRKLLFEPNPISAKTGTRKRVGRGMTATAMTILSPPGKYLSIRDLLQALEGAGYQTKRINVYIMLKRLISGGKVISKKEGNTLLYGLSEQKESMNDIKEKGPTGSE